LKKIISLLIIFLAIFSFFYTKDSSKEEKLLLKRVNRYWESRVKDDLVTCYNLLSSDSKKSMTLTSFIRKSNIKVSQYEIKNYKILKEKNIKKAVVEIIFSGFALGYPLKNVKNRQFWVFEKGNWFVKYNLRSIPKGFTSNSKGKKLNPEVRKKIEEYIKKHRIVPPKIISPEKLNEKKNNNR